MSEISAAVYCSAQPLPEKNPLETINFFISGGQGNLLASFVLISKDYVLYTLDLKSSKLANLSRPQGNLIRTKSGKAAVKNGLLHYLQVPWLAAWPSQLTSFCNVRVKLTVPERALRFSFLI